MSLSKDLPDMQSMLATMSSMSAQMVQMKQAMSMTMQAIPTVAKHLMATASMDMDKDGMSMSGMSSPSSTMDMSAPAATSTGMSGMDMGGKDMGGTSECKISMVWNWNTIDSCFLSTGWHVKTSGQFAGTCIGVFLWVVILVLVGRVRRHLDEYILLNSMRRQLRANPCLEHVHEKGAKAETCLASVESESAEGTLECAPESAQETNLFYRMVWPCESNGLPTIAEQTLRALLFGFEYSVSWLLGLILMSYNGYVIVSAFLGAALGFLIVEWGPMRCKNSLEPASTPSASHACC